MIKEDHHRRCPSTQYVLLRNVVQQENLRLFEQNENLAWLVTLRRIEPFENVLLFKSC